MPAEASPESSESLRILVAIASYGTKNTRYLQSVIETYLKMSFRVDIFVLSDREKQLGPSVKVLVGLPTENPWSLPFAHKPLFAANVEAYDLFIYSEDDMGVTEENIRAFLRVTPQLASDEIAGYLRYEVDSAGAWSLPEMHGSFHWKPESVRQRSNVTVAEFSNEHAAFYILTQAQLRRAIASGGFLVAPYEGRHDMLCAAATDPYINCGFRKVVCISDLPSFCIHHLPNRYIGEYGLPLTEVRNQIDTLLRISNGSHPVSTLCEVESRLQRRKWSKGFYERASRSIIDEVPESAKTILSVGCGRGDAEEFLYRRGATVTVLPLDSVIGAEAERRGLAPIYQPLETGLSSLKSRNFDCIILPNLLHLLPDPKLVLRQLMDLLGPEGTLVVTGPNFQWLRISIKRILNKEDYRALRSFKESGIHALSIGDIIDFVKGMGLRSVSSTWLNHSKGRMSQFFPNWTGRYTAKDWLLKARR